MAEHKNKFTKTENEPIRETLNVFRQVSKDPDGYHLIHHYLYFKEYVEANKAADILKNRDYSVDISESPGDLKWLTLAGKISLINDRTMEQEIRNMEEIARVCGGVYDGWEVQIQDGDASDFVTPPAYD